jgi:hypothetical protein
MKSGWPAWLIVGACLAWSTSVHAECVKAGDTVSDIAGKLLYARATLVEGQTFPDSALRGRAGNYYMRPAEPMCVDKGDGEAPIKVVYLWIDVLRLEETLRGNMQGWINTPVRVTGEVSLDTLRTGATAKVKATMVAQQ